MTSELTPSHEELTLGVLREQLSELPDDTIVRVSLFTPDYDTQTIEECGTRQVYAVDVVKDIVLIGALENKSDERLFD